MKIEERMRASLGSLTRAERQAATHILSHFPMSALGSITTLARAAEVSSPTVVRLVQKLGFRGYSDYQAALRDEVWRLLATPLSLPEGAREPQAHPIQSFAMQVIGNIEATLAQIPAGEFNGAAALLADPARQVAVMGGRLTHAHAHYMATLLQAIRPDVSCLSGHSTSWQQALLDMRPGYVVVIFDIRRYQGSAVLLAELAAARGAEVVLITDRWLSPASAHARHCLPCQIAMPAAWDSTATLMVVVEALLTEVQGRMPDPVQSRLNSLEDIFAQSQVFCAPRSRRQR